ncbi:hypothetical protein LAU42_09105 [Macrococcus armenti]|uniref:hypothetical protein n=1 Tax=Macrococcus armenti TaxID=2875764 RepID=UPI001CCE6937|nr:hypothetical protein [Macrococcus armenti]UBH21922.1 hypothetical protein LAU42_09105 [Macrococcus armenti]
MAEYKRQHYERNKQKYKDKAKRWRKENPERVRENSVNYRQKNAEKLRVKKREYLDREEVKESIARRFREYRKDEGFLKKERARGMVNKRLLSGKIVKPNKCEVCCSEGYVEAHHEDYDKPLEVVWVCKKCHENIHHSNERQSS